MPKSGSNNTKPEAVAKWIAIQTGYHIEVHIEMVLVGAQYEKKNLAKDHTWNAMFLRVAGISVLLKDMNAHGK